MQKKLGYAPLTQLMSLSAFSFASAYRSFRTIYSCAFISDLVGL